MNLLLYYRDLTINRWVRSVAPSDFIQSSIMNFQPISHHWGTVWKQYNQPHLPEEPVTTYGVPISSCKFAPRKKSIWCLCIDENIFVWKNWNVIDINLNIRHSVVNNFVREVNRFMTETILKAKDQSMSRSSSCMYHFSLFQSLVRLCCCQSESLQVQLRDDTIATDYGHYLPVKPPSFTPSRFRLQSTDDCIHASWHSQKQHTSRRTLYQPYSSVVDL